jgi:hypothetical protein
MVMQDLDIMMVVQEMEHWNKQLDNLEAGLRDNRKLEG